MATPVNAQQFGSYSGGGSRMRNGAKKQGGAGHFAETNPRTMVTMQKSRVQLEKEITKLEKQAKTSVNNIANHQQAMKMSWRRLEESRNQESPLLSRGGARRKDDERDRRQLGLLHSNTKLYVKATPSIYDRDGGTAPPTFGGDKDEYPPRTAPPGRGERSLHPPSVKSSYYSGSPYISSPYNIRRVPRLPTGSGLLNDGSLSPLPPSIVTPSPPSPPSQTTPLSPPGADASDKGRSSSAKRNEFRLPPLHNASQPLLVAHSNTVDKSTLMKASALLDGGPAPASGSHGPGSFKDFYSSAQRPPSRNILMSPQGIPPPEWAGLLGNSAGEVERGEGGEGGEGGVKKSSSEPTLAELFEQIKHCRYIRHYHPDGTEVEEYH